MVIASRCAISKIAATVNAKTITKSKFKPMENLPKDLVKVTITEKKRVLVKKKHIDDPDVWTQIDEPKVCVYVDRKDLQLFQEEIFLFRTKKDMGIIPNYLKS